MRYIIFILLIAQKSYGQDNSRVQTFTIPPVHSIFFDFEVLDTDYTLVPLNGGLFCPEKKLWYQTPGEMLVNAVSYYRPGNTMNYSVLKDKSSFIYRTSVNYVGKIQKDSIKTLTKGLFFCKQLDADTLIYGGLTRVGFSIYTCSGKTQVKLFSFDGRISNIQFINSHSFYFQVKNNIYFFSKGYEPKIVYSSKNTIYGFCFDQKGNLFISRKEGIFKYMNNSVSLVLPFVTGFLKQQDNKLYIISFQDNVMIKLSI